MTVGTGGGGGGDTPASLLLLQLSRHSSLWAKWTGVYRTVVSVFFFPWPHSGFDNPPTPNLALQLLSYGPLHPLFITQMHRSSSMQQTKKLVRGVVCVVISFESGLYPLSLSLFLPVFFMGVLLFWLYLWILALFIVWPLFLPPHSPWGPGSCYLNVLLQETLEEGDGLERGRERNGMAEKMEEGE